jgi:hypothetical protein
MHLAKRMDARIKSGHDENGSGNASGIAVEGD